MERLYYLQQPKRTTQFQNPAMKVWETADAVIAQFQAFTRGVLADGVLNAEEAATLRSLLLERAAAIKNIGFPLLELARRVEAAAEDGTWTAEELNELQAELQAFSNFSKDGAPLAKTTSSCFDDPAPVICYPGNEFVVTGQFAWGTRNQILDAITARGGLPHERVRQGTRYLLVGSFVSGGWAHGNFGRKIEGAMQLRESGCNLSIVSEEHWICSLT